MTFIFVLVHAIDDIQKIFKTVRFSEEGSNARERGQNAYMMFLDYLDECEKGIVISSYSNHYNLNLFVSNHYNENLFVRPCSVSWNVIWDMALELFVAHTFECVLVTAAVFCHMHATNWIIRLTDPLWPCLNPFPPWGAVAVSGNIPDQVISFQHSEVESGHH